jgi:hypothetical protein
MSPGKSDANPDPFAAIDAADSLASIPAMAGASRATLASGGGPDQLQFGYQDPVLGYVELRARSDGSGIHASLGAHTEAGTMSLTGSLNELAAWMDARHTPVESLSVLALHDHAAGPALMSRHDHFGGEQSSGPGAGLGQDTAGHAGNQAQTGRDGGAEASIAGSRAMPEIAPAIAGKPFEEEAVGGAESGRGGQISILV